MSEPVLYDVVGHVAVLTLNRPERRNAVDRAVAVTMTRLLDDFEADPGVRAGVLTGAGGTFSSGADLRALAEGSAEGLLGPRGGFGGFVRRLRTKPVIAAVEGYALGGGTELALACDLIVAADDAVFGLPEVRHGTIAAAGGVVGLVRAVPPARARELILTGDPLGAPEAHRLGLVNHVVPRGGALPRAVAIAGRIAANAPVAVRESLALSRAAVDDDRLWRLSAEALERTAASADAAEGARAFVEKREPRWAGA